MREITLPAPDGNTYQIGKLDAMQQWAIAKRFKNYALAHLEKWQKIEVESGKDANLERYKEPSLEAVLSGMSDEDSQTVINTALRAVTRRGEQGGWFPVMTVGANKMQFSDMRMEAMIALTFAVMSENIYSFFTTEQPK